MGAFPQTVMAHHTSASRAHGNAPIYRYLFVIYGLRQIGHVGCAHGPGQDPSHAVCTAHRTRPRRPAARHATIWSSPTRRTPDGVADPGEVVWTWVAVRGRSHAGQGPAGARSSAAAGTCSPALMLTSKDHDRDAAARGSRGPALDGRRHRRLGPPAPPERGPPGPADRGRPEQGTPRRRRPRRATFNAVVAAASRTSADGSRPTPDGRGRGVQGDASRAPRRRSTRARPPRARSCASPGGRSRGSAAVACLYTEESQQPTCPHSMQSRRCTQVVAVPQALLAAVGRGRLRGCGRSPGCARSRRGLRRRDRSASRSEVSQRVLAEVRARSPRCRSPRSRRACTSSGTTPSSRSRISSARSASIISIRSRAYAWLGVSSPPPSRSHIASDALPAAPPDALDHLGLSSGPISSSSRASPAARRALLDAGRLQGVLGRVRAAEPEPAQHPRQRGALDQQGRAHHAPARSGSAPRARACPPAARRPRPA